jgi:hypothetical protein
MGVSFMLEHQKAVSLRSEAMSFLATTGGISGDDVRDLTTTRRFQEWS